MNATTKSSLPTSSPPEPDYTKWSYIERLLDGKLTPEDIATDAAFAEADRNDPETISREAKNVERLRLGQETEAARIEARHARYVAEEQRRAECRAAGLPEGRGHKPHPRPDRKTRDKLTPKWRAEIWRLHTEGVSARGIMHALAVKLSLRLIERAIELGKKSAIRQEKPLSAKKLARYAALQAAEKLAEESRQAKRATRQAGDEPRKIADEERRKAYEAAAPERAIANAAYEKAARERHTARIAEVTIAPYGCDKVEK
ncbi:hypothetical protein AB9F35_11195 [Rhizobium leguminosarum]|uniref:hypothetical protein n=1 Tax=Rhizobium leguminosarum TaxID=384 RepID=UPI003F958FB5